MGAAYSRAAKSRVGDDDTPGEPVATHARPSAADEPGATVLGSGPGRLPPVATGRPPVITVVSLDSPQEDASVRTRPPPEITAGRNRWPVAAASAGFAAVRLDAPHSPAKRVSTVARMILGGDRAEVHPADVGVPTPFEPSIPYGFDFVLPSDILLGKWRDLPKASVKGSLAYNEGRVWTSWGFCALDRSPEELKHIAFRLLESADALAEMCIKEEALRQLITRADELYYALPFHCFARAVDSMQAAWVLAQLPSSKIALSRRDVLALLLATLLQNLDHPGLDNHFLREVQHPLAKKYSPTQNPPTQGGVDSLTLPGAVENDSPLKAERGAALSIAGTTLSFGSAKWGKNGVVNGGQHGGANGGSTGISNGVASRISEDATFGLSENASESSDSWRANGGSSKRRTAVHAFSSLDVESLESLQGSEQDSVEAVSFLASLRSGVLENHHAALVTALLARPESDIFADSSKPLSAQVLRTVDLLVRATDPEAHVHWLRKTRQLLATTDAPDSLLLGTDLNYSHASSNGGSNRDSNRFSKASITAAGVASMEGSSWINMPGSPFKRAAKPTQMPIKPSMLSALIRDGRTSEALSIILKAADVAIACRSPGVNEKWVARRAAEAHRQYEIEKLASLEQSDEMNPEVPWAQTEVEYLREVARPTLVLLVQCIPEASPLLLHCDKNIAHWVVVATKDAERGGRRAKPRKKRAGRTRAPPSAPPHPGSKRGKEGVAHGVVDFPFSPGSKVKPKDHPSSHGSSRRNSGRGKADASGPASPWRRGGDEKSWTVNNGKSWVGNNDKSWVGNDDKSWVANNISGRKMPLSGRANSSGFGKGSAALEANRPPWISLRASQILVVGKRPDL
mmetsp:Transcript_41154/g.101569  ORF Transcript_41154/g.101569 Transcript_41154/m.101569 type:complete len:858 (-) Transcript_41154:164-2737(-)